MNREICVVLLTNDAYFNKMLYTLNGILRFGYTDDICIVIGNDLLNSEKLKHPLLQHKNIQIKHFDDIVFSQIFLEKFYSIERCSHWREKIFQYHKFHLFNTFFKQWNYIFYIDSGTSVYGPITPIINIKKTNKILAHSDAYPEYKWDLSTQFVNTDENFNILKEKYNVSTDYFQTTIMLYDTCIITDSTYNDLYLLAEECKISKTNDQGIIALYFVCIKQIWEQIPLGDENFWYYDYMQRNDKRNKPFLLLKTPIQ